MYKVSEMGMANANKKGGIFSMGFKARSVTPKVTTPLIKGEEPIEG